MYLNIKTEFSFRSVFAPVKKIIEKVVDNGFGFAGIADKYNTFGFVPWEKECLKHDIKPIFGVVLPVCPDTTVKDRRGVLDDITFIARDPSGLKEINRLVQKAYQ